MKYILIACAIIMSAACKHQHVLHAEKSTAKVVTSLFEAFNQHNWPAMAACYSDSAYFLDPSLSNTYVLQSHQQIIKKYSDLEKISPDINDRLINIYTVDKHVIVEFISTGTAKGQKWQLPICSVFTVKDNKIVQDATYYDN